MMKSEYPLESFLGMEYYATDSPGTGGTLKSVPEDFRVDEIYGDIKMTGGPYLICELEKKNWDLQKAVREISKVLGISHRRIGWAGTKDKRAVTRQLISLYGIGEDEIQGIRIRDISLKVIGRANSQLSLGDLKGNRFSVLIRDTGGSDPGVTLEDVAAHSEAGLVPNYFGIQRFGAMRPSTHLTGFAILRGDFKEAVRTYVGYSCGKEPEETEAAREEYSKNEDPASALAIMPAHLRYERAMLHHLVESPRDYEGALRATPPKILSMFVSAVQSFIFNMALSRRMEIAGLDEPIVGDRLLFEGGREDIVTDSNIKTAAVHMRRGRCLPGIFMPGSESYEPAGEIDLCVFRLMEEHGIDAECFGRASVFTKSAFRGSSRAAAIKTQIAWQMPGDCVKLEFELPPGTYATTICREIMKADPEKMV